LWPLGLWIVCQDAILKVNRAAVMISLFNISTSEKVRHHLRFVLSPSKI